MKQTSAEKCQKFKFNDNGKVLTLATPAKNKGTHHDLISSGSNHQYIIYSRCDDKKCRSSSLYDPAKNLIFVVEKIVKIHFCFGN